MLGNKEILLENMYMKLEAALAEAEITDAVIRGEGAVFSKIALIGEAPGGQEEKTGRPFVGAAGKNLDMFLKTLELERDNVYITNVVKWRPKRQSDKTGKPVNRSPRASEIELCAPFLFEELKIVEPEITVTLGNVALKAVAGNDFRIGDFHGKTLSRSKLVIFPLYHPASVIYNRELFDVYENDLMSLKKLIDS